MKKLTGIIADALLHTRAGVKCCQRLRRSSTWHLQRKQNELIQKLSPDGSVQNGPFRGMLYEGGQELGSTIVPKIVGSYEEELHGCLEKLMAFPYASVIDIGCDDGYYATGLAMRMPRTKIFALDINTAALARCSQLAERNGVTKQLVIMEGCTEQQLQRLPAESPCLILSDCEGAEDFLLTPKNLPSSCLTHCDLLIEAHDTAAQPHMARALLSRFADTHEGTVLKGTVRTSEKYPSLRGLSSGEIHLALNEDRPFAMEWVLLKQRKVSA